MCVKKMKERIYLQKGLQSLVILPALLVLLGLVQKGYSNPNYDTLDCSHSGDQILALNQGEKLDGTTIQPKRSNPANALGAPRYDTFFSLGFNDNPFITVAFDSFMTGDLTIYETTWNGTNYPEKADVLVSKDQTNWVYVGEANNQNNLTGDIHPTTFGLDSIRFKYVKVVNTTDSAQAPTASDGFDLNAICAERVAPIQALNPEPDCKHYVKQIPNYKQGTYNNGQSIIPVRSNPQNALGSPSLPIYSLGYKNNLNQKPYVILGFNDTMTGKLSIYEYNDYPLEKAQVYVSKDTTKWTFVGIAHNYNHAFGQNYSTTFNLDSLNYQYVKLVNTTPKHIWGPKGDGFDVNAVCAENKASDQDTGNLFCYDTLNKKACNQYTLPSGSQTITQGGTYKDTLSSQNGCDSILTINLSFGAPNSSTINRTATGSYTVPSGDETYSISNASSGFAFTLNQQLKSLKADSAQVKTWQTGGIKAFGPGVVDFDGNGAVDVPLVKNKNQILLWDRSSGIHDTLDVSSKPLRTNKTLLYEGYWNGSGPSIFYAGSNEQNIYRVRPGSNPTKVKFAGNGTNGVYGIADFDGDGNEELVFADASQTVRYIDDNGVIKSTGVTIGSNNGLGLGTLADFSDNCKASAPIVNGSNEIQLIGPNGVRATIMPANTVEAKKAPIASLDVDNDNESEIVFQKGDAPLRDRLMYVDDVRGNNVTKFVNDSAGNKINVDDERGVVGIGKPNSLGSGKCVGAVKDTLANEFGCDSIITINLTLTPIKNQVNDENTGIDQGERRHLKAYPNPVKAGSMLTIQRSETQKPSQEVKLLNSRGQIVKRAKLQKEQQVSRINTSGLSKGIYLLKTSDQKIQRIIIH